MKIALLCKVNDTSTVGHRFRCSLQCCAEVCEQPLSGMSGYIDFGSR